MSTTLRNANSTSAKVDSLYRSFNKFIIENYSPTEEEKAKYEKQWQDLKRVFGNNNLTDIVTRQYANNNTNLTLLNDQKINVELDKMSLMGTLRKFSTELRKNNRYLLDK